MMGSRVEGATGDSYAFLPPVSAGADLRLKENVMICSATLGALRGESQESNKSRRDQREQTPLFNTTSLPRVVISIYQTSPYASRR